MGSPYWLPLEIISIVEAKGIPAVEKKKIGVLPSQSPRSNMIRKSLNSQYTYSLTIEKIMSWMNENNQYITTFDLDRSFRASSPTSDRL